MKVTLDIIIFDSRSVFAGHVDSQHERELTHVQIGVEPVFEVIRTADVVILIDCCHAEALINIMYESAPQRTPGNFDFS